MAACATLIGTLVPPERLRVIRERPFAAAIRKTFEVATESGCKWTVCIDADVFIHPPGFKQLLAIAEQVPENIWYVQGLTVDKLIPIIRTAGTGIYRSATTALAMDGIPEDGTSLRPETTTMEYMMARGYSMYRTGFVVGMHDFEQYYRDIARKALLHYHKHANIRREMLTYWRDRREKDTDFQAALVGAELAKEAMDRLYIDRDFRLRQVMDGLHQAGLAEDKPALAEGVVTPDFVSNYLANFRSHQTMQRLKFPERQWLPKKWPPGSRVQDFLNVFRRLKQRIVGSS